MNQNLSEDESLTEEELEPLERVEQGKAPDAALASVVVTPDVLRGWLRRCKRKLKSGVPVTKITTTGKAVRRMIFVGAKFEFFEITTAKLYDISYHLCQIDSVKLGYDSPEFELFRKSFPDKLPDFQKSCVVYTKARPLTIVFATVSDRRDFMFLMSVELQTLRARYKFVHERFLESAKTAIDTVAAGESGSTRRSDLTTTASTGAAAHS